MPDDRDRLFEKALARHLRADGSAESLCLDPETLAAYHQRTLSPEELSAAKSHIVSCARCQEILAQLETTEAIADAVSEPYAEPEIVPALATAKSAVPSIREEVLVAAASARSGAPQKVTPIATKRTSSSLRLRWAVPAGAVAAGLLLLIGLREFRLAAPKQAAAPAQIAENRAQVPAPQESSDALQAIEKDKSLLKEQGERQAFQKSQPAAAPMARNENAVRDEKKDLPSRISRSDEPQLSARVLRSPAMIPRQAAGPSAAAGQAQAADAIQQSAPAIAGRANQQIELGPKAVAVAPQAPALDDDSARTRAKAAIGGGQGAGNGLAPAPPPSPPRPAALKRMPGLLRGTVTDPSGAAIAGANVVLKSPNGATVASTSSDSGGAYSFDGVSAGSYQLELQSPGFKTDTLSGLNVAPGENVVNARLEIGTSTETVEVTGQADVINSQAAEVTAAPERKGENFQALLLASSALQTITSPDGKSVWKFGEMGHILHSRNAGKDWTAEDSGVAVKLLAASAPSAKVCWIAGAAGTLLRTTDGGNHWRVVATPITGDLGGVHAADAQHASIWDAPNRLSYETSDGGATWKPSANE